MRTPFLVCLCCAFTLQAAKTTFLIVRHGETDANVEGRYFGWTDIPLNEKGRDQAENLALRLQEKHPEIDHIYSSDLTRAYQTAEPTAKIFDLPIVKSFQLREIYWGKGECVSKKEKELLFPTVQEWITISERKNRWDFALFPEAETYNQLYDRCFKELSRIASSHSNQTIAIFSHGRAIKTLLAETLDDDDCHYPANCQVHRFTLDPEESPPRLHFLDIET